MTWENRHTVEVTVRLSKFVVRLLLVDTAVVGAVIVRVTVFVRVVAPVITVVVKTGLWLVMVLVTAGAVVETVLVTVAPAELRQEQALDMMSSPIARKWGGLAAAFVGACLLAAGRVTVVVAVRLAVVAWDTVPVTVTVCNMIWVVDAVWTTVVVLVETLVVTEVVPTVVVVVLLNWDVSTSVLLFQSAYIDSEACVFICSRGAWDCSCSADDFSTRKKDSLCHVDGLLLRYVFRINGSLSRVDRSTSGGAGDYDGRRQGRRCEDGIDWASVGSGRGRGEEHRGSSHGA